MEKFFEKWSQPISEVRIGVRKVGGSCELPFVKRESSVNNNAPLFAIEISDISPDKLNQNIPPALADVWKDVWSVPALWAKKAISFGAEAIVLRLTGAHPDNSDNTPDECARIALSVYEAVGSKIPLIVIGCEHPSKDALVIPSVSRALKGKNVLLGIATKDNYKIFASSALSDGHSIITESPVDINLAKQLHILLSSSDTGLAMDRIVLHQTTAALGYGYEYCYSIMERTRLAGLDGDRMLAVPMINFVGLECWKLKESTISDDEAPHNWGSEKIRGIMWETVCAAAYLQGGADILVMYHPVALNAVKKLTHKLLK